MKTTPLLPAVCSVGGPEVPDAGEVLEVPPVRGLHPSPQTASRLHQQLVGPRGRRLVPIQIQV